LSERWGTHYNRYAGLESAISSARMELSNHKLSNFALHHVRRWHHSQQSSLHRTCLLDTSLITSVLHLVTWLILSLIYANIILIRLTCTRQKFNLQQATAVFCSNRLMFCETTFSHELECVEHVLAGQPMTALNNMGYFMENTANDGITACTRELNNGQKVFPLFTVNSTHTNGPLSACRCVLHRSLVCWQGEGGRYNLLAYRSKSGFYLIISTPKTF